MSNNLKAVVEAVEKNDSSSLTQMSQTNDDLDMAAALSDDEEKKEDKSGEEEERKESKLKQKQPVKKAKKKKLKIALSLMTPVKPMLARASKSFEDAIKRCPNGFVICIIMTYTS